MTDYKKIADMMMSMPADRKTMNKKDFEALLKRRNLEFVQDIDTVDGAKREVYGNSHFQIIVLHKNDTFQVL